MEECLFSKYFYPVLKMSLFRAPFARISTLSITSRAATQPLVKSNPFSTTNANMSDASKVISETAKQEGGPTQGSTSAQMQSEVGKTRNFEQAAQKVGQKMQGAPETVTSEVRIELRVSCNNALLTSTEGRCLPQVSRSSCHRPRTTAIRLYCI